MKSMMMDQPAVFREQVLFGFVLLALVFVFFRMVHTPQRAKIVEGQKRVASLLLEKSALTQFFVSTPLVQWSENLSSKRGIKMKVLYGEIRETTEDVASLMKQLSEPSFLGNVLVQKINFLPPKTGNGYAQTDFSFFLLANFGEMISYLEKLEQFPALFDIASINLKRAEGQSRELEVELKGRFFQWETSP